MHYMHEYKLYVVYVNVFLVKEQHTIYTHACSA
jgi:hypothetical protein